MSKIEKLPKVFPAPYLVHWATGPVACCESHKNKLIGLGNFMGSHIAATQNFDDSLQCENCINESNKND